MSDRVIVVFDVNVYLDVAKLLGEPFNWSDLSDRAAEYFNNQETTPDPQRDALRCIALASSGRLAGSVMLEVWTSDHIDALVRMKAKQPLDFSLRGEDRGLGWSEGNAERLLDDLVWRVVNDSSGQTVENVWLPRSAPPLSHEDGIVCATARDADDADVLCKRFVVTGDKDFLNHCGGNGSYPRALSPGQFVQFVRLARQKSAHQMIRNAPQRDS